MAFWGSKVPEPRNALGRDILPASLLSLRLSAFNFPPHTNFSGRSNPGERRECPGLNKYVPSSKITGCYLLVPLDC
jgi:hypothetical protein